MSDDAEQADPSEVEAIQTEIARLEAQLRDPDDIPAAGEPSPLPMYGMEGVRIDGNMISADGSQDFSNGTATKFSVSNSGWEAQATLVMETVVPLPG